jgi:hypothetical protein
MTTDKTEISFIAAWFYCEEDKYQLESLIESEFKATK